MSPQAKIHPLIRREKIQATIDRLASEIARDYRDKNPLIIGVLKGSFVFMADLVRRLDFPVEMDFVRVSSYGNQCETSGKVKLVRCLATPVKGRDVLLVEDIVDTGLTTSFLLGYLKRKRPNSLKVCALTNKPCRRKTPVAIDYLGLEVPDKFIVGYGIDWDEKYRNLPDICFVEMEC